MKKRSKVENLYNLSDIKGDYLLEKHYCWSFLLHFFGFEHFPLAELLFLNGWPIFTSSTLVFNWLAHFYQLNSCFQMIGPFLLAQLLISVCPSLTQLQNELQKFFNAYLITECSLQHCNIYYLFAKKTLKCSMENHLLLSKMFSLFCLIILDSSKSHPAEISNKYYSFNMFHLNPSENDKYNSLFEDHLRNLKSRFLFRPLTMHL